LAPYIETVTGAANTVVTTYGLDQFSLSGYFAQATFGYKNLAFVTGAIRADRSSKFSSDQATQTYPKLSASFVPSDFEFWKSAINPNIVSSLKLRTSWGQAGNLAGIGSYDRFWQFNAVPYVGRGTLVPSSQFANPNVKPERMTEFEFGTDIGFWNNRINLGFTTYSQTISDLVVNRGLAPSEGATSIVNNVGQMENNGVEITLSVNPIKTEDFSWDFTFIYSRNRNKVTKLGTPTIPIATNSGAPVYLIEGAPASVFYGTTLAKDKSGNFLLTPQGFLQSEKGTQNVAVAPLVYEPGRDANGQPTGSNIRSIIGNPNPDFTGSFANTISYKNLTFNFLLDWVQ
ncbi:MAG: TonB-dependent receptor domain-containing protein, partial [Flammeovirgaceae bacterium]